MNQKKRDNMLFNLGFLWGLTLGVAAGLSLGHYFWT
jgi:hypothetical protein